MATYTTEITSDTLTSDNPIHQRLIKAYYLALPRVNGDLLEVGCGTGRGMALLHPACQRYVAVDKIGSVLEALSLQFPTVEFQQMNLPPLEGIESNAFDRVVSFQVIEHIREDRWFLQEIRRVLKPGGLAFLSTPNSAMSLTRNPWHIREYLPYELQELAASIFSRVEVHGITGNNKVMRYYQQNKEAVQRITRFDVLNLQHRLPAWMLKIPYDLLNRVNRNSLKKSDKQLVTEITHDDYLLTDEVTSALDLYCICTK